MKWSFTCGDVLEVVRTLDSTSFDGCLCDPPYGIEFMGKSWDHGVPSKEVWTEVLRVLKPGAFLMAYGGTRTHHRLMCNIEDGGFEIRDCLMWLYGSGFPKSLDISKAIDKAYGVKREDKFEGAFERRSGPTGNKRCEKCNKWLVSGNPCKCPRPQDAAVSNEAKVWDGYGTALKPSWEPCIVAMKPTDGSFAENALKHGIAGLNIDAGRIEGIPPSVPQPTFNSPTGKIYGFKFGEGRNGEMSQATGRWPANLILDEEVGEMLDEQSGELSSGALKHYKEKHTNASSYKMNRDKNYIKDIDYGGASRFFYCAKVDNEEREAGIMGIKHLYGQSGGAQQAIRDGDEKYLQENIGLNRIKTVRNPHPTLKPKDLNRYLAKLILPPEGNRKILCPYSGAGSEVIGALLAGWDEAVGIDKEQSYIDIAEQRCRRWLPELFAW